jgi:hypothetical protein
MHLEQIGELRQLLTTLSTHGIPLFFGLILVCEQTFWSVAFLDLYQSSDAHL